MTQTLKQAMEGVYDAFHDIPRPRSVDGCPHCVDKKGISVLLTKALRALAPDDLTHYASSALLTVGTVEDFLYFLPRILEILIEEPDWWPDPEVVTRAMLAAGFASWPDARRQAVTHYFEETISDLLRTEQSGHELDSWICALGRLEIDLTPFLKRIAAVSSRLIEYYEVNSQTLIKGHLTNSFWDDAPEQHRQIVEWFRSPEIKGAIERAYGLG